MFSIGLRIEGLRGMAYSLEARLDKGGFGQVYRAIRSDGVRVAIKTLLNSDSADAVSRFKREIHVMRQLKHPNILPIIDSGESPEGIWYAMPVMHESLAKLIERDRSWEEILTILAGVAEGLAFYHEKSGMHRDVKPENILLDKEGVPKLADFGVARCPDLTGAPATRSACGTEAYMAPEVWKNQASAASDVYALGIVLWELTNGERHTVPAVPPELSLRAGRLEALGSLYSAMTDTNPQKRPRADEVARRCKEILRILNAPPQEERSPPNELGALVIGLGVVALVFALIGLLTKKRG